jgi:lipid-A-disaccharide synthase
MGFTEVLMNIRTILGNFKLCKADIDAFKPDVLILIDYPGFNLRMAEYAHNKGVKVFYYISPQIWAWKQNRVKKIRAFVDEMYVILPFEKAFYKKHDVDVDFVGHPLIDAVENLKHNMPSKGLFCEENGLDARPIVAILPGSRKQEISKMLPDMIEVCKHFPQYQFVIAGAPSQDPSFYEQYTSNSGLSIVFGQTYALLLHSHSALVTSGTATLETAIFKVPQVVCYKAGYISYRLARHFIKVKYISLVNLIMDREIVKELIQSDYNQKKLIAELKRISEPGEYRDEMIANYDLLYDKLGGAGASERTAELMLKTLRESN